MNNEQVHKETLDTGYFGRKLAIIARDLHQYTPQEMARELVRLAKVADESEALASSAAPERSGECADEAVAEVRLSSPNESGERFAMVNTLGDFDLEHFPDGTKLYTRPAPTERSSAPSVMNEGALQHIIANAYFSESGERMTYGAMDAISKAVLAALADPSPTGEGLSGQVSDAADAALARECIAQVAKGYTYMDNCENLFCYECDADLDDKEPHKPDCLHIRALAAIQAQAGDTP